MSGIFSETFIIFISFGCFTKYDTHNGKIAKKFISTSNIMLKNLNKINTSCLLKHCVFVERT